MMSLYPNESLKLNGKYHIFVKPLKIKLKVCITTQSHLALHYFLKLFSPRECACVTVQSKIPNVWRTRFGLEYKNTKLPT